MSDYEKPSEWVRPTVVIDFDEYTHLKEIESKNNEQELNKLKTENEQLKILLQKIDSAGSISDLDRMYQQVIRSIFSRSARWIDREFVNDVVKDANRCGIKLEFLYLQNGEFEVSISKIKEDGK